MSDKNNDGLMQLKKFELDVLKLLINDRLTNRQWDEFEYTHSIKGYEYTGSGYFLKIEPENIRINDRIIHKPLVLGHFKDWVVGFLIYISENHITIECHGYGEKNPPENMRDFDYQISVADL